MEESSSVSSASYVGKYSRLEIAKALHSRGNYATACLELAEILRVYYLAGKQAQSLMHADAITAFSLIPMMTSRRQRQAALTLLHACQRVLPKQRKAAVVREYKSAFRNQKGNDAVGPHKAPINYSHHQREGDDGDSGLDDDEVSTSEEEWTTELAVLPADILLHIFRFLDGPSLGVVPGVCRLWREVASDDSLWEEQYQAVFGKRRAALVRPTLQEGVGESTTGAWRTLFVGDVSACLSRLRGGFPLTNRARCTTCKQLMWLSTPRRCHADAPPSPSSTDSPALRRPHVHSPWPISRHKVAALFVRAGGATSGESSDSDSDVDEQVGGPRMWAYSTRPT